MIRVKHIGGVPGCGHRAWHNQIVVALRDDRDAVSALARLARDLEALEFGADAVDLSAERDRLAGTIRHYLIPRAVDDASPVTIVFAGPTGSGKSTLINSLARAEVSPAGALRPTTRSPVVIGPTALAAEYQTIGGVACHVVGAPQWTLGRKVLVDAPDIDSTSTQHRGMAETLIDNADLVVFVSSALRYADDVPWQVLRRATSRGTPVIMVLNRVSSASAGAIVDFKSRLRSAGLGDDLVTISEYHLAAEAQNVPDLAVRSLQQRLEHLAADGDRLAADAYVSVFRSTLAQAKDLMRSLTKIEEELDDLEAELAVYLADRQAGLDITAIGRGLGPVLPSPATRRAIRRWKKLSMNQPLLSPDWLGARVAERLESLVEADMRHWVAEERDTLRAGHVDRLDVLSGVSAAARSAAKGWVAFVLRIALDQDEFTAGLGAAVMLEAATGDHVSPTVTALYGDAGSALVERARRELVGRLEAVYQMAGTLLVDGIRHRLVDLDNTDLLASLGAVSTLAPVHA